MPAQDIDTQRCQELYQQIQALRKEHPCDKKSREEKEALKDAQALIKTMKGAAKSEDYNLLVQLIEDVNDINDTSTKKDTQKQMRTILPSFMTEVSDFPEVREVEVSTKNRTEKKHQEEMEMLLDKKRRANFLKEHTRQEPAKTSEKVELKQSQQKLGDIYQNLIQLRDGKESENNREFDNLMNEAKSIMKSVNEMKEPSEDELYILMCKNIKAIAIDKQRKSILAAEEVPILVGETSLEADKRNIDALNKDKTMKTVNNSRDQEESEGNPDSDRISIEVPSEMIVKDLCPALQGKEQPRIKDTKENSDNLITLGPAILSTEKDLKQKKYSKKKRLQSSKYTKEARKRNRKDKVKKMHKINKGRSENERKKFKLFSVAKSTEETLFQEERIEMDSKKSNTESEIALMIPKVSPITSQTLHGDYELGDCSACNNCEKTFKDPSALANHTLACKPQVKKTVLKEGIKPSWENTDSADTEEDITVPKLGDCLKLYDEVPDDENMYCGEVMTLNRALGATSDSDTEEEKDETIVLQNGGKYSWIFLII